MDRDAPRPGPDHHHCECERQGEESVSEKGRELLPEWRIRRFGNRLDPWRVLGVWLLRQAAGLSQAEIAARLDIPQGSLTRLQRLHATLLEDDLPYREAALELALRCFR